LPRQFDIVENLNLSTRAQYPFLVILQHDRVATLRTVVAAPLAGAAAVRAGSQLQISIAIAGRRYVMLAEQLAAIQTNLLGRVVASAESIRYEIVRAIDLLFTGI
jgi:toxin CcdB